MTQGVIIGKQTSRNMKPRSNRIGKKDKISTMPDEILENILSRLTVKEAARTSVLSTRWRTQWTYFSGVVDFDYSLQSHMLRERENAIVKRCNVFLSEWKKFMTTVDCVMKKLKSSSIKGLRVCMDLGNPEKLAEWLKFAEEKNIQMLDLDFQYNFAVPFFETSIYIRNKMLSNSFKLNSLRNLRLITVDVSDEVIEGLLVSSPHLETLCVMESRCIKNLKVSGAELKLKHLELVNCLYTDSLYISGKNLKTFRYIGDCDDVKFGSVPNLVEVFFGGRYCTFLQLNMDTAEISGLLSQVHVVKLMIRGYYLGTLEGLPEFNNVKQLELQIPHDFGAQLDRPVSLLSAFPSISVLKIMFQRKKFRQEVMELDQRWTAYMENRLPNLIEMQISGYKRDPSEIEMLVTIFKNAPNLKRVVVDPLPPFYMDRTKDVKHSTTSWYIEGLKPDVPSAIEFIVL